MANIKPVVHIIGCSRIHSEIDRLHFLSGIERLAQSAGVIITVDNEAHRHIDHGRLRDLFRPTHFDVPFLDMEHEIAEAEKVNSVQGLDWTLRNFGFPIVEASRQLEMLPLCYYKEADLSQKQLHVLHLNKLRKKHSGRADRKVTINKPTRNVRCYQR